MIDITERLRSWAQNEEMIDSDYLAHGRDCNLAADEIKQLRSKEQTLLAVIRGEQGIVLEDGYTINVSALKARLTEALACAVDATLQQRAARIREEYLRKLLQEACDLHSGVRPDSADDWKRRATDFLDSYKEQP